MQPALQLVSKVLSSNHPMTLAWAEYVLLPSSSYLVPRCCSAGLVIGVQQKNSGKSILLIERSIRKLRPVRDSRDTIAGDIDEDATDEEIDNGLERKNFFSVWPEFSGREEDLDQASRSFEEMRELCETGFDSTRYACEILKRSKYQLSISKGR